MKERTFAREKAIQALYQIDINKDVSIDHISETLEDLNDYSKKTDNRRVRTLK